ncbi:hypothetical protein ILYODFUR_022135 [Ilyodon furcidens]|uniref:Uncharacterized protein n=1 Tax=Ilyodon furcidens TaxID=33524 RepID=A0ABV0TWR0_9TELE
MNRTHSSHMQETCPTPTCFCPPMFLLFILSLSHYYCCREQSPGTVLQRTLRSLISSFRDMAVLTSPLASVPQGGFKWQLPLAEKASNSTEYKIPVRLIRENPRNPSTFISAPSFKDSE